jgi:sorbitol/mannitol transport system permease protein
MAFYPTHKSQSLMLWMLSTKMMPAVGVLIPIYIIWQRLGLLDTIPGLIIIYTLINLPIAVWMSYTYFSEVPKGILEAGRIDGANAWKELWYLLWPMTMPGLSTKLKAANVAVDHACWPGMVHGLASLAGVLDAGKVLIDRTGAALRKAFE